MTHTIQQTNSNIWKSFNRYSYHLHILRLQTVSSLEKVYRIPQLIISLSYSHHSEPHMLSYGNQKKKTFDLHKISFRSDKLRHSFFYFFLIYRRYILQCLHTILRFHLIFSFLFLKYFSISSTFQKKLFLWPLLFYSDTWRKICNVHLTSTKPTNAKKLCLSAFCFVSLSRAIHTWNLFLYHSRCSNCSTRACSLSSLTPIFFLFSFFFFLW